MQDKKNGYNYELTIVLGSGANKHYSGESPLLKDLGGKIEINKLKIKNLKPLHDVIKQYPIQDVLTSIDQAILQRSPFLGMRNQELLDIRNEITKECARIVDKPWLFPALNVKFKQASKKYPWWQNWLPEVKNCSHPLNKALEFSVELYKFILEKIEKREEIPNDDEIQKPSYYVAPIAIISLNWDWGLDSVLMSNFGEYNLKPEALPEIYVDFGTEVPFAEEKGKGKPDSLAFGESACQRRNRAYSEYLEKTKGAFPYDNIRSLKPAVIMKFINLHGSTNWVRCDRCGRLQARWFFKIKKNCSYCNYEIYNSKGGPIPFIVTPTYMKELGYYQLLHLWTEAANILINSEKVVFIGYSLPPDDFHIRRLLFQNLILHRIGNQDRNSPKRNSPKLKVYCISKGGETKKRYKELFKDKLDKYVSEGWNGWSQINDICGLGGSP